MENCGSVVDNSVENGAIRGFSTGFSTELSTIGGELSTIRGRGIHTRCLQVGLPSALGSSAPREALRLRDGFLAKRLAIGVVG